ncbi:hypothetical protein [Microcoleus vaginatus]|uniref:hypothetical protein n=1 Tax=Microcoleus vaginatus TaxID=119532 RepID=UPI0032A777C6
MNACQSGKNSLWCWRDRISDTQKKSDRTSIIEGRSLFQQLSHIMSGSITIIKAQLGATNGNLSNLELSLAVGVIVGSD